MFTCLKLSQPHVRRQSQPKHQNMSLSTAKLCQRLLVALPACVCGNPVSITSLQQKAESVCIAPCFKTSPHNWAGS